MAGVTQLNFDSPDETRTPPKTRMDVVRSGATSASRLRLEPGWRWSECIKPTAGTERCQMHHVGIVESGSLHVEHEDGSSVDVGPGNAYVFEPGHDAWVVGDEPFVAYEFDARAAEEYARG
jgi:hypothetical protein